MRAKVIESEREENQIMLLSEWDEGGGIVIREVLARGLHLLKNDMDRSEFLRKKLSKNLPSRLIERAILTNPVQAGVSIEELNAIADGVIERAERSLLENGAVDLATYYAYLMKTYVELLYLYGFPSLDFKEKDGEFLPETLGLLTLCLGAGYGIYSAKHALKVVAAAYRSGVKQRLIATSLTKGGLQPFVQKTEAFFEVYISEKGFKMQNSYFCEVFFKSSCQRFQACLLNILLGSIEK